MELVEIVDRYGKFTGEIMAKEEAHDRNLLHNEVAVLIVNDNKQVLLERRSANKRFEPNKWALCAGHVEAGEGLKKAMLRELKEELGIDTSEDNLTEFSNKEITIKDSNSHITYFYYIKLNLKEEEFKIEKEELSEVKWFEIDEVIDMIKNKDASIVFTEERIDLFEELKRKVM